MAMEKLGLGQLIKDGHGNTLIYTALIAACLSNIIPTPADYLFFRKTNELERAFDAGEISAEKAEIGVTLGYYGYTTLWYAVLFLGVYSFGGTYKNNARVLLGLLASGLVIGAVAKNIQADESIADRKAREKAATSAAIGSASIGQPTAIVSQTQNPTGLINNI